MTEKRFANGQICPLCGGRHIARNGHRKDGTQRYICRECGKSFVIASNSILSSTKKRLSVWQSYVACMMQGLSVRKSAKICGIHWNTAFAWRHKILDALQNKADKVILDGIVEADETFFPVSYKGNHSKSKDFNMPRESLERGNSNHTRGISHEQVCVPCAVNRNGQAIAEATNTGRISAKELHGVFDGRIADGTIFVTDGMNWYVRFANESGLCLKQLKEGKTRNGIYHIQHVNSYHSVLKRFMVRFNGVSTKYLDNYLVWNSLANYGHETDSEKEKNFLSYAVTATNTDKNRSLHLRPVLPQTIKNRKMSVFNHLL